MTLTQKLHPDRFTGMSNKMAAIVGYILGEVWTNPVIEDLSVTSDGMVIAFNRGGPRESTFIGSVSDLDQNMRRLLDVAGLTDEERREAWKLYRQKVTYLRG